MPFRSRPHFVIARGRWWLGWESLLQADGWLINCFGLALFIPNEWIWRKKQRVRAKLHL
jgi:hypothetical protein